jgi:DNA-binding HxlR family transcriptional regulator
MSTDCVNGVARAARTKNGLARDGPKRQTQHVKTYGQYCPIARAAEVLATRWTPLILRNLLLGATTFTEIADGAPGIPRTLLASRLRELERTGVVSRRPLPHGRGSAYGLTSAGEDLRAVMLALGTWGERWMELAPEHLDPGVVLSSWCRWYLAVEQLPAKRVVARFDFPDRTRKSNQLWMIFDGPRSEVCRTYPGYVEDLVVTAESLALAEWHLGRIEWSDAIRSGRIRIAGSPRLARALPAWNLRSGWAHIDGIRSRTTA